MILIIDNYDSFTYNLYQIVSEVTEQVTVVRNDQISLDEIAAMNLSGIILSPGPGRPEEAGLCIEIVKAFSGKMPILGVCLGHQAIIAAFGGAIIPAKPIMHGKSTSVFHDRSLIFDNMPQPFIAGRYHSLTANKSNLPDVLNITAETSDGLIMAVKHQSHPTYGVQFHPESILSPNGPILLKTFIAQCKEVASC